MGILNLFSVFIYRFKCKIGYYLYRYPVAPFIEKGPMFKKKKIENYQKISSDSIAEIIKNAENITQGSFQYFSNKYYYLGSPPNWFLDPINNTKIANENIHWSKLSEFSKEVMDIKIIWEPSRFDWAIVLAKAYNITGESKYIDSLNLCIKNWQKKNPVNQGPNWKCGQEASIRLMQLLLSRFILGQHLIYSESIVEFVREHCKRINSTILYAIAQNNNHGTSEAAALYIGGALIFNLPGIDKKLKNNAIHWHRRGKAFLENRVKNLILTDGSFSQYSTNYHRVLLDTLNIVEFWRQKLDLEPFSVKYYSKVSLAVEWLFQIIDTVNGDVPNMGGNDGARLFVISNTKYRDYRSTVQLSAALFNNKLCFENGPWDDLFYWLKIKRPTKNWKINYKSVVNKYGGYVILRSKDALGVVKFPNYKFRPSNCDALHLDLWKNGLNILRDGGSYCYSDSDSFNYFAGNKAHNTVQFNNHNQMPLVRKFLFGQWLECEFDRQIKHFKGILSWGASYKDYMGYYHRRIIAISSGEWSIIDELNGKPINYTLRWRLAPGDWGQENNIYRGNGIKIFVESDDKKIKTGISTGYESMYYLEKTKLPVLEIKGFKLPVKIETKIRFEA